MIAGVAKLIAAFVAIAAIAAILAIAKMNENYLMMILPKGIHIEFRNKNHPDNMGIEGIDNRHILDDRQNAVEEHMAVVEEHMAVVEEHMAVVEEHMAVVEEHMAAVEEHMTVVEEHMTVVEEHMTVVEGHTVAAEVAAAAEAGIDNKHIQDANDANVVDAEAEHIAGSMLLGVLQ